MFRFSNVCLALVCALAPVSPHAETTGIALATQTSNETVTVFAAASLKNALDGAASAFKTKTGIDVKISYAGSMALAKQIEAGAPADVFFSADEASMDYLAARKLVQPASRAPLLGNTLVVVAPRTSKLDRLDLNNKADFAAAIGDGKIATGDVTSVPVGKYAKAALEKLGLWSMAEPHFAFTDNVRSALMFVAREEAPLGIVYLTDARSEPKVKIVATFPGSVHPPIIYSAALTEAAKGEAPAKLLLFLKSKAARPYFVDEGFSVAR